MMKKQGRSYPWPRVLLTVSALVACLAAGLAQSGDQKEAPKTKRTYTDQDIAKYKDKGNVSQSTLGKPKAAAKDAKAKPSDKAAKETPFNANLGTEGKALRDEFLAAHKQAEAARKASEPLVSRWGELHKRLAESRSVSEREKIKAEIKALEGPMGQAIQESNQADERFLNAMEKANAAGVLNSTARQSYEKDKEASKKAFDDGR